MEGWSEREERGEGERERREKRERRGWGEGRWSRYRRVTVWGGKGERGRGCEREKEE